MTYGVSPAFFLSAIGNYLVPSTLIPEVSRIRELGFTAMECEVVEENHLGSWEEQVGGLAHVVESEGLGVPQIIAHFMIDWFSNPEAIASIQPADSVERMCDLALGLPDCSTVVVPIGPFSVIGDQWNSSAFRETWDRFVEVISEILQVVEAAGLRLSLEIQPGSLLAGSCGFLSLCSDLGTRQIGYNFDTGHAWAMKECLELIPARLSGSVSGTHLCDNFGGENLSLQPGTGSIDWKSLLASLLRSGYAGPLDVEIFCKTEEVLNQYRAAREFLEHIVERVGQPGE